MKLQYTVVFERTPNNYCAYVPDLPGCIGTDRTWEGIQDAEHALGNGSVNIAGDRGLGERIVSEMNFMI
jgi:hypothetical protein